MPEELSGINVVLDNATMHKGIYMKALVEYLGIRLHFTYPHTPSLNLIEYVFRYIKRHYKKRPVITV